MDKKHFASESSSDSVKPKQTDLLIFDIETVPFRDEEYNETQKEYIQRKLLRSKVRDPNIDLIAEEKTLKGTDAYLAKVVCIGLYYPLKGTRIALTNDSEKTILESFWNQLVGYSGTFVSYNGIRFDIPFLIKRSLVHGLTPTNMSFVNHTRYNPYPPHFDVFLLLGGREVSYTLREACNFFGVPSPKEGAVSSKNVAEAYYSGRIKEIAEYCVKDLESTYQLYDKVRTFIVN